MKHIIGIEIERTQNTVIMVEVEAEDLTAAETKAAELVRKEAHRHPAGGQLHGLIDSMDWTDGAYSCLGVNHDEKWGNGDYSVDIAEEDLT